MTITVSISNFRSNISDYLAQVKSGHTIILKDEKKNIEVAEVKVRKKFNSKKFWETLKRNTPIFTDTNHPEWKTKRNIIRWVNEGRKAADRTL